MILSSLPPQVREAIHFKSSENIPEIRDESVQAIVTSPPYWKLKDYRHKQQIGFGDSYEKYLERLDLVWRECYRALKPTGTAWIVVDKIMQADQIIHIPFEIAQRCRRIGFLLQDMIIWNKPTAIAGMSPNNLVNKYENVIFLSRSESFKLKLLGDRVPKQLDYDRGGKLTDLWRYPVKAGSIRKTPAHEAPYPEELIERIIRLSTDKSDLVLDPFLGSGTTMKVALKLSRKCVGYEINADFASVIADRLSGVASALGIFA